MANSVDFRADQVQVNKLIVTGSNAGSPNALLVYGLDDQTSPLNQGYIDPAKFPTGSIGSDVFFYVSGGIGGRGVAGGAVSVFGGDVHISGNLTVDGTYPGGGGGTPGGSVGQVQYNAGGGNFGGLSSLTYTGGLLQATGSFSGSFQGSFSGTANNAVSASYADQALSASYASVALSASYSDNALTASYAGQALSASYADNALSASYASAALSASYADNALSASYATNALSASYASQALSASYSDNALSASYADNALSASYASQALSASYADNAGTASIALSSIQWQDGGSKLATTSSVALAGALGTGYFADNLDPGINLFVSGTAVIGGNLVVSGALQTDTILGNTLQGSKITSDYIELVNVTSEPVPSVNGTYLYASGSTNDFFIVHNNSALNKTNFRWVENTLGTGLLQGGILSTETGTTTFSVQAGEGIILSYNATTSSNPDATIKQVQWNAFTSQSLTYISSDPQTFIGINDTGVLFQQTTPFTSNQYELYIPLGRILHVSGATTYGIANQPRVAYGQTTWNGEFNRAFGPLKLSGHVLAASGSTLSIVKSGGSAYAEGKNYAVDPNSPNLVLPSSDGPVTVSKVFRQYVSGSDSNQIKIDTNGGVGFTEIDPNNYNPNNAGTLTPVTSGKFTIQRVYWAPNSSTNAFWVYYGSGEYNSLAEAQAGIPSEIFQEGNNTIGATVLVANVLVASGATDLSNPAQAQFVQGGLFRGSGTGIGGAGGATVPGGINTYIQFNDGGSTFGGDPGFTYNKTTNTMTVENISTTIIGASTGISSSGTLEIGGNTVLTTLTASGISSSGELSVGGNTVLTTVTASNLSITGTFTSTGPVVASGGLSGSLQNLADGSPYLVAGANITVNTASSGQVSITGSIGGTDTQIQYNNNGLFGGVSTLTYNGSLLQGTGSFSGSFQGTLDGTASFATNAGNANTVGGQSLSGLAQLNVSNTFTQNNVFTTATGSFSGSYQGNLTGTASYASNAGLLNNLADTAFAKLASANTFTQNNVFTSLTASSISSSDGVSIAGNVAIAGATQITGAVNLASTFSASGQISTAGNLRVQGTTQLTGAVNVGGQLTASTGLNLTGASTFAAGSTFTFNGNSVFAGGLSGSLQKLSDGTTNYLLAGPNIVLTTQSNGQIAITGAATASAGAGGLNTQIQWNNLGALDGLSQLTYTAGGGLVMTASNASITNAVITNLTASNITASGNVLIGGNLSVAGGLNSVISTTAATTTPFVTLPANKNFYYVTATANNQGVTISAADHVLGRSFHIYGYASTNLNNIALSSAVAGTIFVKAYNTAAGDYTLDLFKMHYLVLIDATVGANKWAIFKSAVP